MSTAQQLGLIGNSIKVQSLPTASAETFGAGNRFYTLIGQQEGYITGHTYRTVVANDVYSWEDVAYGNYNMLDNIPVINQDLSASGFTPVANTYYRHTGTTTASYTNGVIYYYNGTGYAALDGSGSGGGKTYQLVKKTVRCTVSYDGPVDELQIGLPSAANKNILDVIKENNNCSLRLYLSDNVATSKYVDLQPHQHQNDSTKIWFDFTGGFDSYAK